MFQGSSAITLDAKGRLSIPAKHRDVLASHFSGRLTLTRSLDACLLLYPRPIWEQKKEALSALPASANSLQRRLIGGAQNVEMDGTGRILVPPELRQAAGLTREVVLVGIGNRFELWDAAQLEHREAEDLASVASSDALSQFSF